MRAHADEDQVFGLERARVVLRVLGLFGLLGLGIAQLVGQRRILQRLHHFRRAVHDEDGLAAPVHLDHRARLELADVLFHRRAQRLRACTRFPGGQERHGRHRGTGYTSHGRRDQQEMAPAAIHFLDFSTSSTNLREASFARAPHAGACEPGARFQTFKEFRIIHTSLSAL